jgi:hypothetical protein
MHPGTEDFLRTVISPQRHTFSLIISLHAHLMLQTIPSPGRNHADKIRETLPVEHAEEILILYDEICDIDSKLEMRPAEPA